LWWGLISYVLAGNWTFVFSATVEGFQGSAEAGKVFWYITYLAVGSPVLVSLLLVIAFRPKRSDIID
jgi:hypothetical protein